MQLKDQAAIVTGGASGLGAATARKLAAAGAEVAVCDLNAKTRGNPLPPRSAAWPWPVMFPTRPRRKPQSRRRGRRMGRRGC